MACQAAGPLLFTDASMLTVPPTLPAAPTNVMFTLTYGAGILGLVAWPKQTESRIDTWVETGVEVSGKRSWPFVCEGAVVMC